MSLFSVILFFSTNNAMWAAKLLKKNNIERKMIPIPRHLSSDCGYCVRIDREHAHKAVTLMDEAGIEYDRIEPFA